MAKECTYLGSRIEKIDENSAPREVHLIAEVRQSEPNEKGKVFTEKFFREVWLLPDVFKAERGQLVNYDITTKTRTDKNTGVRVEKIAFENLRLIQNTKAKTV